MKFKPLNNESNLDRDLKNSLDTAFDEGFKAGKIAVAKKLKALNIAIDIIARATGLTIDEIQAITSPPID